LEAEEVAEGAGALSLHAGGEVEVLRHFLFRIDAGVHGDAGQVVEELGESRGLGEEERGDGFQVAIGDGFRGGFETLASTNGVQEVSGLRRQAEVGAENLGNRTGGDAAGIEEFIGVPLVVHVGHPGVLLTGDEHGPGFLLNSLRSARIGPAKGTGFAGTVAGAGDGLETGDAVVASLRGGFGGSVVHASVMLGVSWTYNVLYNEAVIAGKLQSSNIKLQGNSKPQGGNFPGSPGADGMLAVMVR
jgi:hypothetical protein